MSCPVNTNPLDVIVDLVSQAGFVEAAERLRDELATDSRPAELAILDILHQIDGVLYGDPVTNALQLRVGGVVWESGPTL